MADFLPFVRRWFDETFAEATRAQREGWEAVSSGRDTFIGAPPGSGKTLAAFLWALDHLCRLGLHRQLEDRVYVVYVSPLRALNNDIEKNLRAPLAGIRAAAAAEGLKLPEMRVAVRTADTLELQPLGGRRGTDAGQRSAEHTSVLQSRPPLHCRHMLAN